MTSRAKSKANAKTIMVRTVCLVMAGLMLLSVVLATVWQW